MPLPFQPEWAERGAEVVGPFHRRRHVKPLGEIAKMRPRFHLLGVGHTKRQKWNRARRDQCLWRPCVQLIVQTMRAG